MAHHHDRDWAFHEGRHLWMPYCQMKTAAPPLAVARTEGDYILLQDGRALIDGIASWWTACHGYNHPRITAAVVRQVQHMPHVMFAGLVHDRAAELAGCLTRLLPGSLNRVFFCDSGSVAVEIALKVAVQYWLNRGERDRHKFVSFRHGYHGDTTGAMSVCDPVDSMHSHFKGFLLEQFPSALPSDEPSFDEFDRFLTDRRGEVAGVILEPLAQMAAGMRFHTPEVLRRIAELCRQHGLLFIADEIATGFGRTGSMFAVEQAGICPDILCVGKALTGGLMSLAATVVTDEVYAPFHCDDARAALMHGPTFMANPLACAAAVASLELFSEEPRLEQVACLARRFAEAARVIAQCPAVESAESLGALLAVRFPQGLPLQFTQDWFLTRGIWLRPIGNVLYTCPPFTIRHENLEHILEAIQGFAREWQPTDPPGELRSAPTASGNAVLSSESTGSPE